MRASTSRLVILCLIEFALLGCASKDDLLPQDGKPMNQVFKEHMQQGTTSTLQETRTTLRRPMTTQETELSPYVRNSLNETKRLFRRLPNPDLVMFSFPHLATKDQVPIPGYSTVFPFYEKTEYALPGEPTE